MLRCFGLLVADECHFLKGPESNSSVAVCWVAPREFLGASATLRNTPDDDCKGYMLLIVSYEALSWWQPLALTAMKVDADLNPYLFPDVRAACTLDRPEAAMLGQASAKLFERLCPRSGKK